jgi:hypothetical protein
MDLLLASLAGAAEVKRSAKMDDVPRPGVLCQLNSDSDSDSDNDNDAMVLSTSIVPGRPLSYFFFVRPAKVTARPRIIR